MTVNWCVSTTSWDAQYATLNNNSQSIGVFDPTEYNKIGFISIEQMKRMKPSFDRNILAVQYLHKDIQTAKEVARVLNF